MARKPKPLLFFLLSALSLRACRVWALHLPTFVSNHMVLQRAPQQAKLWGWADSDGAIITATLTNGLVIGHTKASMKGSKYYWEMDLSPQPASVNLDIVLTENQGREEDTSITLHDVAFGDVYLCSGQSNMEMSVSAAFEANDEVKDSANYPHLRLATVSKTIANMTQDDVAAKTAGQAWWRSGPNALSGGGFGYFSAACYFAGRDVYKALGGLVPIGLVSSSWGGQKVETFSSPDALADKSCGGTVMEPLSEHHRPGQTITSNDEIDGPQATELWYGMITPLLPMRLSAVLWYQGESNAGDPSSYSCRFPAMITDWRVNFGIQDLPFFYVQLAAFPHENYSLIRAAQDAALELENVYVALGIDLGDPTSPWGPIHPRRKQEVGYRLALDLMKALYEIGTGSKGPEVLGVEISDTVGIVLKLNGASNPFLFGTAACSECCHEMPFETLSSLSGNWTRLGSRPVFGENEIIVAVEDAVIGLRYNWEAYPQCAVYDSDRYSLPMHPFEWCEFGSDSPPWTGEACSRGPTMLAGSNEHDGIPAK